MASLSDQLKNLSPEKRALLEKKLAQRAGPVAPTLAPRSAADPRVLSAAQHQLWFLDQLAPGGSAYNVPYAVRLTGHLDPDALQKALDAIVGRHEVLRTMLLPYQGKVLPAVAKQWSVELLQEDARGWSETDLQARIDADASRSFDLARGLKLRAALYRTGESAWTLVHVSHHIAWDLQSRVVFYQELERFYRSFVAGEPADLPPLEVQYADYALWQRRYLQGEALARLNAYWKESLTGAPAALTLPIDFPRPAVQRHDGLRIPLQLGAATLDRARTLARQNQATLYMVLLAAFYAFLRRQSGQDDLSVGSPFDIRSQPGTQALIGMFINTLVLRARIDPDADFLVLIAQTRRIVLDAISHQELPFERIVDAVQPPRDLSRMLLFQANFRLQGAVAPPLRLDGATVESIRLIDNATAKFDIALELPSTADGAGYLEINTTLITPEHGQRMIDDFQALLADLLARPEAPLRGGR